MAKKEPFTVIPCKTTNPTMLDFPTDAYGVCSGLRKEFITMTSKIGGHSDKYAVAVETLGMLIGFMQVRHAEELAAKNADRQAYVNAVREESEQAVVSDAEVIDPAEDAGVPSYTPGVTHA